jgi:radical SAM protein with 4Fe4S-binding SPASM domain
MKAEIKPRIELENRTRLEEVIPLETPFVVFLDPSDHCNFRCKFCPTGNSRLMKKVQRPLGFMDFDLYKKIIDDLSAFKKPIKVLRLYKDGEPLLNPKLADMIRYGKDSGCALQIDTTTNASLLQPRKNLDLIHAGLDRINISINGLSDQAYREFTRHKVQFDRLVENIRHFYEHRENCLVCIKIIGDNLSKEEQEQFFAIFGNMADRVFIEHIAPCWPEFEMEDAEANASVGIYGQEIQKVEVCPYIFYSLSINSDGKVSLCFLDWSRRMILGDLKTDSFKDVWKGDALFHYRKMHLSKKRKSHPICGKCGQLSHCLPDDIDAYAGMLLERFASSRNTADVG